MLTPTAKGSLFNVNMDDSQRKTGNVSDQSVKNMLSRTFNKKNFFMSLLCALL